MTIRWCGSHGYEVHERMKRRLSERSLSLTWFAAGGPTPERRLVAGVGRRSGAQEWTPDAALPSGLLHRQKAIPPTPPESL